MAGSEGMASMIIITEKATYWTQLVWYEKLFSPSVLAGSDVWQLVQIWRLCPFIWRKCENSKCAHSFGIHRELVNEPFVDTGVHENYFELCQCLQLPPLTLACLRMYNRNVSLTLLWCVLGTSGQTRIKGVSHIGVNQKWFSQVPLTTLQPMWFVALR